MTLSQIPAHNHGKASLIGRAWNLGVQDNTDINATGIINKYKVGPGTEGFGGNNHYNDSSDGIEIDASHTHTTQGGGGAHNHGNTGGAAPNTNSKTLTTNSGGGTSGAASLTSGSSLSNITIDPSYTVLYIWRRTK